MVKIEDSLRLHRLAFKLCLRCGKRKTIKSSINMWKRSTKYLNCVKCREKDRLRKRKGRIQNGIDVEKG